MTLKAPKPQSSETARLRTKALGCSPAPKEIVFDFQVIQGLADALVNQIHDGFRFMVKGGHGGQNQSPQTCRLDHEFQMPLMQRGLSDHKHQWPSLLEGHIRCPYQEVVGKGVCHGGQGLDRAGDYDHAMAQERTACQGGCHVFQTVDDIGQCHHIFQGVIGFQGEIVSRGVTDNQVGFSAKGLQDLEGLHTV